MKFPDTWVARRMAQQQGRCFLCGMDLAGNWNWDHVVPIRRGGVARAFFNIVLTHPTCNSAKGSRNATADELARLNLLNESPATRRLTRTGTEREC